MSRRSLWLPPSIIAAVYFTLHMLTASRYGIFRDAMYLLDCSRHLAWGYVDHPPLFPFIAWIARHTLGESLPALLVWPALAGVARILFTALFARQLGAGPIGMAFTAFFSATTPGWLVIDHQFSMNAFDPLFWTGCAYAILCLIQTGNGRFWLLFGLFAGFGMEDKYSIAGWAAALLLGLLISPQRRLLFTPWLIAGGAVALAIFAPNLIWEIRNDWPFLQFLHNVNASGKDILLSPLAFVKSQILIAGPAAFPFWFGGLLYVAFGRETKPYRALAWAFLLAILLFLLVHGKDYYSLPAYPTVFAMAGFGVDRLLRTRWFSARPARKLTAVALVFIWIFIPLFLLLPMLLPVLSLPDYLAYQKHLPISLTQTETEQVGSTLPPYYADEFGWEELAEAVAKVYNSLPPNERPKAAILTGDYGQAGAIDYFGPRYGLPQAISGHNTLYLWGPREYTGEIVILVGSKKAEASSRFASVEEAATFNNPYGFWYEKRPILLCRGLKGNLQTLWPKTKHWQ